MTLKTVDGRLVLVNGRSRCGRTSWTYRQARQFKTAFVFDIDHQWYKLQGFKRVDSLKALRTLIANGPITGRYAYLPQGDNLKEQFDAFCKLVMHYGTYYGACAVVAEELAEVTTPGKASSGWGSLLRRGLKRSISIFAIIQSWSEGDKTAMRNASEYVMFMMEPADIEYMARKTGVPAERLQGLHKLEFIVFDTDTREATGAKLHF